MEERLIRISLDREVYVIPSDMATQWDEMEYERWMCSPLPSQESLVRLEEVEDRFDKLFDDYRISDEQLQQFKVYVK